MKWIKVLCAGLLAAVMLSTINSCGGVPDPIVPAATAVPADGFTIKNSDSIVITFSTSMTPGSLTLSGDMASVGDGGVWSKTSQINDTLTINPGSASGGVWTVGSHTLIVDVLATSGVPLSTLVLNYTVDPEVPTAAVVPANNSTIIGSDSIVILFSVSMDPSTLVLSGDMVVESRAAVWSTTKNTNDTLVFQPSTAWSGNTDTLIIDVDSTEGVPLPTLTLNYSVDISKPTAFELPESGSTINASTPIVIGFTIAMNPATLVLTGSLASESDPPVWTTDSDPDDTLTISPISVWSGGNHTLIIDVDASNGFPLKEPLSLNYFVDDAMPTTASVTPATGSNITGDESIVIVFDESVDIATLTAFGSLWDSSDNGVWSRTTNTNDTLTLSPATSWPVQTIDLILDIADLVGNSLVPLNLVYNVDTNAPIITLLGLPSVSIELGTAYVDAGATAFDDPDGDITGNIATLNPVVDAEGTYTVTYDVDDAAGNVAVQVTRTVIVTADVTKPVITLTGVNPVSQEAGTPYTELGATATDNVDTSLTVVIDSSAVNINVPGSYPVTYNVSDTAGNAADEVTRTVNVTADVTKPIITLNGADTVSQEAGTPYTDLGATATDNVDSNAVITGLIVVDSSAVDTNVAGSYSVTYNVTDTSGNAAVQVTRTVNVTSDITKPVITLSGAGTVSQEAGTPYSELGATATDNVDSAVAITAVIVIDSSAVNINVPGSYSVTYNVTDTSGNAAVQVTRTVNVTADVTKPVITLTGANPVVQEAGTPYTELGATATDNVDTSLTVVINSSAVNVNAIGSYIVTYNVTDTAGNVATQVTRTVNVTSDITKPVITLSGANPVVQEAGTPYTELGATATDNVDTSLTVVIDSSAVNINAVGSYLVTYNVTDTVGNAAVQVTRTVNITADVTKPVITLTGVNPVVQEAGTPYTELGATATDNVDTSLTVVIDSSAVNINAVGSYLVTYNVTDTVGNAAVQVTRTVNITADVTKPVITLTGVNPVVQEAGTPYTELGATATDNVDTSLTVVIDSSAVNINVAGNYLVKYNVTDTAGNAAVQVTRTVNVTADVTKPVITLNGAGTVSQEAGTPYSDLGATATDNVDSNAVITGLIVIDSSAVNTNVAGSYSVTYNVTDTSGNAAVQVTRTVIVTADVIKPIIILTGADPVVQEAGTPYSELGATATDNVDSNAVITGLIVIDSSAVNINVPGSYSVTYNVTDTAGNAAVQVTRTVNVTADVTKPVINLTGVNPVVQEAGTPYSELGATATDNVDSAVAITAVIVIDSSAVNINAVGSYLVTYNVTDTAGNAAVQVTRTVNITADITKPVINLTGVNPVVQEAGTPYTELGATATDNVDTSLMVVIDSSAVNINAVGSYLVTYNVTDTAGNAAVQVTRTVSVTTDVTKPVITLLGDNPYLIPQDSVYAEPGATVADNVDTGLVAVITGTVNTAVPGDYILTYNVSDTAGNAATPVTRTVTVVDGAAPVITLLGDNPYLIPQDSVYAEPGATVADNVDTGLVAVITGTVNTAVPGDYILTYNVSDTAGNAATPVTRTVTVVDGAAPVITLLGDNPYLIPQDSVYAEPGATVADNVDTGLVAVITGTVNTAVPGDYILTYNVSDTAGNTAAPVTRTVTVVDGAAPVITLLGDNPYLIPQDSVYAEPGATVADNVDTGLVAVITGTVNTAVPGDYNVMYNVSDTAGNAAIEVIRVVSVTAP